MVQMEGVGWCKVSRTLSGVHHLIVDMGDRREKSREEGCVAGGLSRRAWGGRVYLPQVGS